MVVDMVSKYSCVVSQDAFCLVTISLYKFFILQSEADPVPWLSTVTIKPKLNHVCVHVLTRCSYP